MPSKKVGTKDRPSAVRLTDRELQILWLASEGKTDKEIAADLRIATATLCNYWTRIRLKLSAKSKTEAVALYKDIESREIQARSLDLQLNLQEQAAVQSALRKVNKELKQAEESQRNLSTRLAEVIWGTNSATWEWNIETGETVFNDRWAEIVGYTLDELAPVSIKTWEQLAHPVDLERSYNEIEKCFTRQTDIYDCEARMLHKDGHWVWVHDRGRVVEWSSDGLPVRMSGTHQDITARKNAENELQESNDRYRALSSLVSEAIYIHKDDVLLDANEAFVKLVGAQSINEVIGKSCLALMNPTAESLETIHRNRSAKSIDYIDIELITRDGSSLFAEAKGEDIVYQDQQARLVTIHDLTARRKAEQRMREQESNFETAFESIGDMVVVATPDGKITYSNQAVTQKLGYTRPQLQLMHVLDLHPPDVRNEAVQILSEMFAGTREHCPLPVITATGDLVPVETRVWKGKWDGEDCIYGVIKDLTAQVEAQQRFERLFKHNPTPMALSSVPDRLFYDVNDAFCTTLGYTREEVVGKSTLDLNLFSAPEVHLLAASTLQKEGRIDNLELEVRSKDGTIVHGLFSGDVISSQGKEFFLTVMVDITARKRLEHQLREKYRMDSIATLAGGIAHDFNNILSVILGNTELLRDASSASDELRPYIDDIEKSAERAIRLVHQILAFSQHKVEEMKVQPLNVILQEGCRFVRTMAPLDVDVLCLIPEKTINVRCSSTHIDQVLVFLCSCAWQQIKGSKGSVRIALDELDSCARLLIRFSRDDGMPLESESDVIRSDHTIGQAMSIVDGIVEMHHGTIRRSSNRCSEADLVISLPLCETESADGSGELCDSSDAMTRCKRVIFVDDEEDLVVMIRRLLQKRGIEVVGFVDPFEAFEYIKSSPDCADVLLTDFNMPEMTGMDLLKKTLGILPQMPTILISGYVTEEMQRSARDVGVKAVLYKETSVTHIAADICSALSDIVRT